MRALSAEGLPEECRTAVQASGPMPNMQGMDMSGMMQSMQGMMANMNEAQKGYMEAMTKMHGPMMTGMMSFSAAANSTPFCASSIDLAASAR